MEKELEHRDRLDIFLMDCCLRLDLNIPVTENGKFTKPTLEIPSTGYKGYVYLCKRNVIVNPLNVKGEPTQWFVRWGHYETLVALNRAKAILWKEEERCSRLEKLKTKYSTNIQSKRSRKCNYLEQRTRACKDRIQEAKINVQQAKMKKAQEYRNLAQAIQHVSYSYCGSSQIDVEILSQRLPLNVTIY